MLLFRSFVDFIGEDVLFSDIEWVYFSLKSCKYDVFQVVLAVWDPLVFIILELRNLNQLDWTFDPQVPKSDGIVLTWSVEELIAERRNGDEVLRMDYV